MLRRHPGRFAGGVLAEFVLVTPLLLVLLLGCAELSWTAYTYHFVEAAACDGARFAIVRGSHCFRGADDCPASVGEIQNYVRTLAPSAMNPTDITAATVWTPNHNPGSSVQVTVLYPFFNLELPSRPSASLSIQSSCAMVISQ